MAKRYVLDQRVDLPCGCLGVVVAISNSGRFATVRVEGQGYRFIGEAPGPVEGFRPAGGWFGVAAGRFEEGRCHG